MPKEITIPLAWLKRLDELTSQYLNTQKQTVANEEALNLLLGYLQSVKFLLK